MSAVSLLSPESSLPGPLIVVEDEPLISRRLERILHSLGYTDDALIFASTMADARTRRTEQPVAMALIDLGLPDGSGIDLIRELRAADADVGILVISAWSTETAILAALRAGANGYLLKERDDLEVTLSIRSVLRGGAPIDPFMARRIIAELQPSAPADAIKPAAEGVLSVRELQILRLVADGMTNREIAGKLFISRYTVECHVKTVFRKLAVANRTKAVNEARTRGLLE